MNIFRTLLLGRDSWLSPQSSAIAYGDRRAYFIFGAAAVSCVLTLYSPCYAAKDKDLYDLQERCAIRSAAMFDQDNKKYDKAYRLSTTFDRTAEYRNHYNEKTNRCYMMSTVWLSDKNATAPTKSRGTIPTSVQEELWDVNDHDAVGSLYMVDGKIKRGDCYVGQQTCDTQEDWLKFLAPYLEHVPVP